jgi:hypothetical protein
MKSILIRKLKQFIANTSVSRLLAIGTLVVFLVGCGGAENSGGTAQDLVISNSSSAIVTGLNTQSNVDDPSIVTLVERLDSTDVFTPVYLNEKFLLGSFSSGLTTLTWSSSNSAQIFQNIEITPEISIGTVRKVSEGKTSELVFLLSGSPVVYPVIVDYRIFGTGDNSDHNLMSG